ncbi:hypothetical protein G7054_g11415 [Neopestalotiopsis clavispora]|nr:hypothetical protein E8E14_000754 [Neopestalotiopsis sp. 37M]KAF7524412.1 hypothetical protein G7054_g11415 [Neopestalotiopsis clavispora]
MTSHVTCQFENLPPEILLQVAKCLPDLATLHVFAIAAPAVYRLLRQYGGDVLEAITCNASFTMPQTRDLIRVIVLARTSALPAWTVDGFTQHFLRPTMMLKSPPEDAYVPPAPAEFPFSILGTARRVNSWVQLCLATYLRRLRDAQSRLRRPSDPGFNYTHGYGPEDAMVPGWRRRCDGVPYDTPVVGPISWVEEQVVVRAFWRLQLFFDLNWAAREGRLDAWRAEDRQRLSDITMEELFGQMHPFLAQYQELLTVAEFLQQSTGHASVTAIPAVGELASTYALQSIPETDEYWMQAPLVGGCYEPQGLRARPHVDLTLASVINADESPIRGAPMRIFRRLGLAIWSDSRLASLGLKGEPRRRGASRAPSKPFSDYWFQWRSLLTQDELCSVEEDLEKREQERKRLQQERFARWQATGSWD